METAADFEGIAARSSQDRSTHGVQASGRLHRQRLRVGGQESVPTLADAQDAMSLCGRSADDGANRGIQPWTIPSAGENPDMHEPMIAQERDI